MFNIFHKYNLHISIFLRHDLKSEEKKYSNLYMFEVMQQVIFVSIEIIVVLFNFLTL